MKIHEFETAGAFLERAGAFLEAHEAANSLLLGVVRRLGDYPERFTEKPFLGLVEEGGRPILAAMMTPPYDLALSQLPASATAAVDALLAHLLAEGWALPGVLGPVETALRLAEGWAAATGGRFEIERRQRVHAIQEVLLPRPERGLLRPARAEEVELLVEWRQAFAQEALPGQAHGDHRAGTDLAIADVALFVWDVGRAVSMAQKTRPTRHGISISLVYTPPELRRRGYATACVAELSRRLLAEGCRFCALYTDLSNPTSNHIYWEIGYRPVGDVNQYRFYP